MTAPTGPAGPGKESTASLTSVQTDLTALRAQVGQLRVGVEASAPAPEKSAQIAQWTAARDSIRQVIGGIQPADLFAGLDAQVPLALLPVRLETRFADPGTDVLRVRIFPDDVHVDGHDTELTDTESALGTALWAAPADLLAVGEPPPAQPLPADSSDGRRARWAALVTLLGGPRAAWVAQATRPKEAGGSGIPAGSKPQAYVRPAVACGLPDRWLVRAYSGAAVVGQAWTTAVGVDLHLAPDPQAVPDPTADTDHPGGLPPVDPQMRWLLDYATAVTSGMAVDVPLPPGTNAVDRVVAVGVRASSTAADAAAELAGLLTAHRYTDGLGFLAAGSPTSNNPDSRAAADRHADPDLLWQQEFGASAGAGTAAAALATALGLPAGVADGSAGSADTGDATGQAMQTATWAATWGYYLGQLLDSSVLGPAKVDAVRSHYLQFVRGSGTLPTLRVGRQPYGVLPLVPLDRWVTDGASPTVDGLARLLTRVRPLWQYGVGQPVTASEGPSFDDAFTRAMSTDAVARGYSIRSVIADRTIDPVIFTGIDAKPGNGVIDAMIGSLLSLDSNPLILDIFSPTAQPVRAPLVVDPTDPTPDATVQAAIRGLSTTNPQLVLTQVAWLKPRPQGPATVLHTILRRSLLLEYANAGISLTSGLVLALAGSAIAPAAKAAPASALSPSAASVVPSASAESSSASSASMAEGSAGSTGVLSEREVAPASMMVGLSPDPGGGFTPVSSMPAVLSTPVASVTGGMAVGEYLWRNRFLVPTNVRRTLDETLDALDLLAGLTAEELELLLPDTLDLATHRWTAWAESVAADKLARLRTATPAGIALGGWGVVERVSRQDRVAVDPGLSAGASAGPLWEDARPGGFVHAPSTAQAATAAVLRAAHLAHGGEADPTCAIDLSSGPARAATALAQGIAYGQELGALLGYEIEQFLHDRSADVLIAPLRAFAPRWKASGTFVEGAPEEIVSPSAVVDGLALADADPSAVAAAVLAGVGGSAALASALSDGLAELRRQQDALADLLTAEGIHHVLAGNTARAAAVLDAANRGGLPPAEFEVLRTPRSGSSLTCRVGVLLPEPAGSLPGGWPDSPRGSADPAVARWLAEMLPALSRVRVRVATPAPAGAPAGTTPAVADQALPAAAGLGPLDLVLDHPEVIRTRIELSLAPRSTLVPGRDPAWTPSTVGLDELLTVAADLREVLACRALRRTDLMSPAVGVSSTDERDAADLQTRLTAARAGLQTALTAVSAAAAAAGETGTGDLTAAGSALVQAAAHGVVLQLPPSPDASDIVATLASAAAELQRRLAIAAPPDGAPVDDLVAAVKAALGSAQPAVPRMLLDAAVSAVVTPGLVAGDGYLTADPELAADWLGDVGGVRAGAGRLVAAVQGCDALGAEDGVPDRWRIIDPSTSGTAWTATLGAADLAAVAPAVTVVLQAAPGVDLAGGKTVSGLLVDEWVEVVPQAIAATSVAYQAEAPAARAPQAILLGVAPDTTAGWDVEAVVDLVLEALSLTGLRTVDAETGAWLGRMLPAILLPDGDATDVIAAPPMPLLQIDESVLAAQRLAVKELG